MNFELPKPVQELKARAHEFSESVLVPLEKSWPHHTDEVPIADKIALGKKGIDAGIIAPGRPKAFGGQGLGALGSVVVNAELARTTPGFSTFYDVGFPYFQEPFPIFFDASEHIKDKYTSRLVKEGVTYSMMMSEPQSGSDFTGMLTTARRDGDNYVINGQKIYPTAFSWSLFSVVWAVVVDEKNKPILDKKGRPQITAFIAENNTLGMKVLKWVDVLGIDLEPIVELKDCVVPAKNMLGEIGQGMAIARGQMNRARLGWGAASIGSSERSLELAIKYAKERRAFGRAIGEFQAIQWWLADSYTELQAMRQLNYYTAARADRDDDLQKVTFQTAAAVNKMFCLERALGIVDRCMQVHGAIGMTGEYPFEYLHRQLKSARAAEGSPQIMRHIIATDLLGKEITSLTRG